LVEARYRNLWELRGQDMAIKDKAAVAAVAAGYSKEQQVADKEVW
jgi:hypothetical protein